MRLLLLFLDGVGLGANDLDRNPLARAEMPNLTALLDGRRLVAEAVTAAGGPRPLETARATLVALDACLGVAGLPQSATGQAALLTGRNVPAELGYHYGPKPNAAVRAYLHNGALFRTFAEAGRKAALLNAYPQAYFEAVESGQRLYSAIPLAVVSAGIPLKTAADLHAGEALAADFTAQGWRERLRLLDTPVLAAAEAGARLAALGAGHDFSFFEYWLSDYAGHYRDMEAACRLLATFDQVLGGLLASWDDEAGLIVITSDHGNMEDLSTRSHTPAPVPALVIGATAARRSFAARLRDLTDIAPAILALT
jgi:hypothetical protein